MPSASASAQPEPPGPSGGQRSARRWPIRKWLLNWHRDVGFLVFGLTVAYAISGLAVNHHHDWNYNETTHRDEQAIGGPAALLATLPVPRRTALETAPTSVTDTEVGLLIEAVGNRIRPGLLPRNHLWRDPSHLVLFYGEGNADTVEYSLASGIATRVTRRDRLVLRDLNFLHLNESRGAWTWVADGYAALLLFLAISGVLVVRGRKGLRGRGGLLLGIGVAVPIVAVWVIRYF